MKTNKILYIIRWLPWSGKTTFAKSICNNICEADEYFMQNGKYIYNPSEIKQAHEYCQNKCEDLMKLWIDKIAVSNTFIKKWEIEHYIWLAQKYEYMIFQTIVENINQTKNTHNVPENVVDNMKKNFEI